MQLALDMTPRQAGEQAAQRCTEKAERIGFDTEGAGKFILGWLARHGQMSGEALVDAAIQHGYRPHDQRAFGAVFGTLSRKGLIRCAGYCEREKGHGTAGGRLWESVR
jgi:hypothetical protein